jgi:hypothetical protein
MAGNGYNGSANFAVIWKPTVANGTTGTYINLWSQLSPADQITWSALSIARDICEDGTGNAWVTGFGITGGVTHAFRLSVPTFVITPEPSTLVLVGMGLIGLVAYAWRKRK